MRPIGCEVERLDGATTAAVLDWLRGGGAPAEGVVPPGLRWALFFSDGGVTWGRRAEEGWKLSSGAFPEVSPELDEATLQELRVFGTEGEVRIWAGAGSLEGRTFRDRDEDGSGEADEPRPDRWLLVGDQLISVRDGFALVKGRAGRRQALPLLTSEESARRSLPWFLEVRHHFEEDERSGNVRVTLTRLLDLSPGPVRPGPEEGGRS